MNTRYVVSADISLLMNVWSRKSSFIIPGEDFFLELRRSFEETFLCLFQNFELVEENEIVEGMKHLVAKGNLPVITLESVYCDSRYQLAITRVVDHSTADKGLYRRYGTPTLRRQVNALKQTGLREFAIFDDVLFTGSLLERLVELLSQVGISVPRVYVGVGISQGVKRIESLGCIVESVRQYKEVVDQVCERDFYPGVPFSGRLLLDSDNVGLPYIMPFGNPNSWASIPEGFVKEFSQFCIRQSIALFAEIEKRSLKVVYCKDIPRAVGNSHAFPDMRFVDFLMTKL